MKPKGIYIAEVLHQRIKQSADQKGMKIFRLVEMMLTEKLDQEKESKPRKEKT